MKIAFSAVLLASLTACGHGLSAGLTPEPIAANAAPIIVDGGPASSAVGALNSPYVTVTICVPGTATCQNIDHVLLDTGSVGLRVVASALSANLNLPQSNLAAGGTPLWECLQFSAAYSWGSVRTADVKIANGTATSQPIQLIGVPTGATVPLDCVGTQLVPLNTVETLGANGILGVNAFQYDCPACVDTVNIFPRGYYSCPTSGSCTNSAAALSAQVQNPIYNFPADNNGIAIVFPAVAAPGQSKAKGLLILGIDSQSNNQLGGTAVVVKLDSLGFFTTTYNGTTLANSFIDTGTPYLSFVDGSLTACLTQAGYFCPPSVQTLHATNQLSAGVFSDVSFNVDNYETLKNTNPTFNALPNIAATIPPPSLPSFVWGMPFFYGRTVFVGFDNRSASQSTGPFVAY